MKTPTKYSHQREAIFSYLKQRKDHPTAENVYIAMKETMPNISLGTVYRNLNQLSASGQILRLSADGKTDHFDACIEPHYHFVCKCCGAVKDVDMEPLNQLLEEADAVSSFTVEEVSVLFSGTCEDCA